jgi:hypothetical protein
MPIRMVRGVFFMLFIAIAAVVPIIVAMMAEENAIIRVVDKADIISSFSNSFRYHLKVNPPHFALDFDSLNESTINMSIGAYKNNNMEAM